MRNATPIRTNHPGACGPPAEGPRTTPRWLQPIPNRGASRFAILLALATPGCSGPPQQTPPLEYPLELCSPYMHDGATVTQPSLPASACIDSTQGHAALSAGSDLSVPGFRTVGPAVTVSIDRPLLPRGMDLILPLSLAALPDDGSNGAGPIKARFRSRLVVLGRFGTAPAHVALLSNPAVSAASGGQLRVHLPGHEIAPHIPPGDPALAAVATFQVAIPEQLGQRTTRHFTFRAIGGVSMGGLGSSINFFKNPSFFDAIGVMGADPGPDLTYTQYFIHDLFFGGFCTQADQDAGKGRLGSYCPQRQPLVNQGEVGGFFDDLPIQTGEGIGLTLNRGLFLRANRDLVRSLGNWAYWNPQDPYLPPSVPAATLAQTPADACAHPFLIKGTQHGGAQPFYDGRYNPQGAYDVISFCDGGSDGTDAGKFDPDKPQVNPAQILLAVDYNGNGRRDPGEAVVLQPSEPYGDVGTDGLPDAMEPGYDPVTNPDPSGDDYHYLKNPGGTEGNGRYEPGEPYVDAGLDGVMGKGCDIGTAAKPGAPGCFDYGEGNGSFDYNPGVLGWLHHDPQSLVREMPQKDLDRLDIYYDAGIRDFFNAEVSTNSLMGVLATRGKGAAVFDGFPAMQGLVPAAESQVDPVLMDVNQLGRWGYVRYGDPEVTPAMAAATGDGRHVGTILQAVDRALVLFKFLLSRWPDPDLSLQSNLDSRLTPSGLTFTMKNGRATPYGLLLPPGYFDDKNAKLTYPVIYFGHGYGMDPESLAKGTGQVVLTFMSQPVLAKRLPKAIMVFIDGVCRPGGDVPDAPLPAMGDLCEEGGFYADHPQGTYLGESMIEELDTYLRAHYRIRAPQDLQVDE